MDELYSRVSEITKQVLYPYIKEEEISTLNYHFHYYFDYCIHGNNIQVISHHFSNHKIEGLTVIDKLGTSFSYEQNNPVIKRVYLEEDGLRLVSINKKYKDKFAPYDDDPRIVGKIVGNFMPLED
ncbi:S24 family peptidase [Streptococcus mitis]|uniref:S24 family peptidase n=1 Tax=Streptococcus mitis TaxID=28037 RepID=UPI0021B71F67|nr:S24 family peptidase [Streptococcus mitis]